MKLFDLYLVSDNVPVRIVELKKEGERFKEIVRINTPILFSELAKKYWLLFAYEVKRVSYKPSTIYDAISATYLEIAIGERDENFQ